uniref:ADP-ribosyl cyclase/cyclic ADP-ribose hydrolase n=1 Tax=Romanomermis culicivorax TaxID=13658 RepID=A0A915KQR1_ROMCU
MTKSSNQLPITIGNRFAYAPIVTSQASSVTCQTSRAPYSAGILYGSTAGASSSSSTTAVVSGVGGSAGSTGQFCTSSPFFANLKLSRSQADSVSVCGSASSSGLRTSKSRSSFVGMEEEADKNFYLKQSGSEYGMAKHLHTELVMSKHTLKGKMTKFQRLFDRAFSLIQLDTEDAILEGIGIVAKVMMNAWVVPKIGHDLAYGLCDYLREMGYFDTIIQFYLSTDTKERIRRSAGRALEECLSGPNRDYLVEKDMIDDLVNVSKSFKEGDELRVGVSLLESLFKQSSQTNSKLIEMGALDYVLDACKATTISQVFRHAALALANLSMYSENDCQQKMITKNVPDWLFLLASSQDDVTRYYACLAICALVSNKEIEVAVIKSGTLSLVEPFLLAHKPNDFANSDYRHNQGRPREWLEKLIPLLNAKRREPRSMAAFHFAMEAGIKKDQDQLEVFEEIGAIEILKQVASYPEEVAPKFATLALEIIGAEVPYKLSQQVPLWSVEDVQYWVTQIGFENYAIAFQEQKVDGDLLLLLTDKELEVDIDMKSSLLRKRFMRELDSLKIGADYSCIDETQLDRFLVSISPQLSIYTYQLLEKGADRSILPSISDDILKSDLGIRNPIDRFRLIQALEDCKHIDDMEIAILSRHIDIFISYRRSTGNQLASLIKVLLQLRGYKVFIDVDRLYAGKFDLSLLKNIQAAKHFILVLTPQALDRCCGDDQCHDWVHKEVLCAFEHNKNVIPIFDPQFEWPDENLLPGDIRVITRFNGVRWVHEYQDACVDKLEKFIKGELNLNRGFFPHQDRGSKRVPVNYRSNSSKQNSNPGTQSAQLTPSHSVADNLIETLSNHRSRTSSSEDILQAVITSNSHDLSTFEPIVDR